MSESKKDEDDNNNNIGGDNKFILGGEENDSDKVNTAIKELCKIIQEEKPHIQEVFRENLNSLMKTIFLDKNNIYQTEITKIILTSITDQISKTMSQSYLVQHAIIRDLMFNSEILKMLKEIIDPIYNKSKGLTSAEISQKIYDQFVKGLLLVSTNSLIGANVGGGGGGGGITVKNGNSRAGRRKLSKKRQHSGGNTEDAANVDDSIDSLFKFNTTQSNVAGMFKKNTPASVINNKILYIISTTMNRSLQTPEFKKEIRNNVVSKCGIKIESILKKMTDDKMLKYSNFSLLHAVLTNDNTHKLQILFKHCLAESLNNRFDENITSVDIINNLKKLIHEKFTPVH